MTKEKARELIEVYGRAWEARDPELIVTIFTDDATYNDPREPENNGIDAIRKYWETKVIGEQKNIKFDLLNIWMDGETVIAEWHATFEKFQEGILVDLTEVAIFGTRGDKFSSLREYYKSIKTKI